MLKSLRQLTFLLIVLILSPLAINAQTIRYVKPTATGTGDGLSWANASGDLQAMIDASATNNEVWVAAGTYKPNRYPTGSSGGTTSRDYAFILKNQVKVYGSFVGTEVNLTERTFATISSNPTILSGDINNTTTTTDDIYHVILSVNDDANTVIDGFTITRGNANNNTNITIESRTISRRGGGMFNSFSSPNIRNCLFSWNLVQNNGYGAAIFNDTSSPTLNNCFFIKNLAIGYGGAIANISSNLNATNCLFFSNESLYGGGVYNDYNSNLIIYSCTFFDNKATYFGGGISNYSSATAIIKNSVFWNNTIGQNVNSIDSDISNFGTAVNLSYCLLQLSNNGTNYPNTRFINLNVGNLFAIDPLFLNPNDPDGADNIFRTIDDGLTLLNCSPAVNTGDNIGSSSIDITGATRIYGNSIDIGAYENQVITYNKKVYVKANATGANNGTSWSDAFINLQSAMDLACYDTIWVAAGTYIPTKDPDGNLIPLDSRNKTFYLKNQKKIYGGFAGNETTLNERTTEIIALNPSILSGDINNTTTINDDVYHVVLTVNDDNTTSLDGFIITKGNANGSSSISVESKLITNADGGGLYNQSSNLIINNCSFLSNAASNGGGGIYNNLAFPSINNCSFLLNKATNSSNGGGIYNISSSPTINNSSFSNNSAYGGGGIYNYVSSSIISNCNFSSNTASVFGGAFFNDSSTPIIYNCSFSTNSAIAGGGFYNGSSSLNIYNCSFSANNATYGGGINNIGSVSNNLIIKNSIFWDNKIGTVNTAIGADIVSSGATTNISHSILQLANNTTNYPASNFQGTNIGNTYEQNPLFLNPNDPDGFDNIFRTADDGLTLQNCSPAINSGDNSVATPFDITGATRIYESTIDKGAYENHSGQITVTLSSTHNNAFCVGTNVSFTANTSNLGITPTYNFKINNVSIQNNSNNIFSTSSLSNGDLVKAELTSGSCVVSSNAIIVAVNDLPIPTKGSNSPICEGNILNLTSSGGSTYAWAGPNNFSSTEQILIFSNATTSLSGTYSVTITNSNGCSATASTTVTVNAIPNPPTIISPNSLVVCSPNTLTLTATGCDGILTWSNNSTGTSLTISEVGTYSISANCTQNSCISEQSLVVAGIEIKAKPSPPTIILPNSLVVCSPNSLTLTATGCAGVVTWSNNATGTSLTISEVGTYSISANCTQNGCISEQSLVVAGIEIKAKPSPPTIISPNSLVVCSPNSLTLTATGCDGILTWSNNATGTSLTISEVGTYSISANCTQNGCISEQSLVVAGIEIKAKPSPPTIISPNSLVVCSPNSLTLTATGCAGVVTWSNNATGTSLTISEVGTYSISANCTQNGCISVQSSTISGLEIKTKPNLVTESNSPICAGSILNLISSGGNTYSWAGPNGYSSTSQNLTLSNATNSLSGTYTITTIETNGCSASTSITILVRTTGRIYVNDNATGANNGTSWGDAFTDLQAALDYPCSFDEIWVAGGTYKPSKDPFGNVSPVNERDKAFYLQNGKKLYGGFAGHETSLSQRTKSVIVANPSILSGDIGVIGNNTDNVYHVIISINDDNTTLLDGFSITNGNANGYGEYQIVIENQSINNNNGGGLCNNLSTPTIQNCTFSTNFSRSNGGGIFNENASPIINNCSFLNNTSEYGGGMYNTNSSPIVNNTIFSSNISSFGAGVYNIFSSNSFFTNCLFFANVASDVGGGIYNFLSSSSIITNCTFSGNTGANSAGGIFNFANSNIIIKNSVFWKNKVNSNTTTIGVDIINNGQGLAWVTFSSLQLPNNTTNYPVNSQIVGFQGDGVGNIYATDPLFTNDTDPDGNDNIFGTSDDGLALQSTSPVINIGDPSINSPATDITGFTRTLSFDLGAYEYSPCSVLLNFISTNDDYSTGTYKKLASSSAGKIIAMNKIVGTAKVTYKAKTIELNAGFKAENGTVFTAEIGGCN